MATELDIAMLDEQLEKLLDLDADQRNSRLAEMQRTEPDLAAVLRKLVKISTDAQTLDIRNVGQSLSIVSEDAPVPQIEGYRIIGETGRGGMATVYAALRSVHGTDQQVAIKVLRAAILSPMDRERFLNEQRILARLQHPHIATLLDVGVVDERPYMVLEWIDGDPITSRLQPTAEDLPTALDSILQVAEALQLAHAHFVIHRDIKPDNVLVDRQGRIKLIDFGVAKILQDGAGLSADPTLTGAAPMTLRYASPEQLLGRPIGVASDIYQLGLLLNRLLTGAWPFNEPGNDMPTERLRPDSMPIPPSAQVSEGRLRRLLVGDLDSIVLKCLRFEAGERYRSVTELHEDIVRHQQHRPVQARRQTRGYFLKSFIQRHRLGVAIAAASLLLVLMGVIAALVLAARTQLYAQRLERTLDAVTEMFSPANPYAPSPKTTTVAEAVDQATTRLLSDDTQDAEFQARMLVRLAGMQEDAENFSRMRELLDRAQGLVEAGAGDQELRNLVLMSRLNALFHLGEFNAIGELAATAKNLDHNDRAALALLTARVLIEQGHNEDALRTLEGIATEGLEPLAQSEILIEIGLAQTSSDDFEASLASYAHARELLDPGKLEHLPAIVRLRGNAATALGNLRRSVEAAAQYQALLDEVRQQFDADHPLVAKVVANSVVMLMAVERFDDAYALIAELDRSSVLRDEPSWRAQFLSIQAGAALASGHFDDVIPSLVEAAEIATQTVGSGSPRLAYYADQLAWSLFDLGQLELAVAAASKAQALSDGARSASDLVLQLASELGIAIANRPDPGYLARTTDPCNVVHYQALRAKLVEAKDSPELSIPGICAGLERARMEALGLKVQPARPYSGAQPIRSPQVQRWQRARNPLARQAPDVLDAALMQRVAAVIDAF